VRKKILGWVFDGARQVIELPHNKLDSLIAGVKVIIRHKAIPFK